MARTAMIARNLKGKWGDALEWVASTKYQIPHRSLNNLCPAEIFLSKELADQSNLRAFVQPVMIHIYEDNREDSRWGPRDQNICIIGYTETHGIYQAITTTGKRINTTNDPRPIKFQPEAADLQPEAAKPKPQHNVAEPTIQQPRRSTRSGRDTRPFD